MSYTIEAIATVRSPYTQKFGIPRQSHLVPAARCRIEFAPQFGADSVRGLEGFGYIWVQFVFHDALAEGWAQMVRPPRLGGRKKVGVFASRSPHRPNHLGLSLLKLETVGCENGRVFLECSGADLLDGTPVVDVKPYIPFVEARPDAATGFAAEAPPQLRVEWQPESGADRLEESFRLLVEQSIAQDPRPAYQDTPGREYAMAVGGADVRFLIEEGCARIIAVSGSLKDANGSK